MFNPFGNIIGGSVELLGTVELHLYRKKWHVTRNNITL